ncbi:MFS transporter [Candidatus Methanoplasma termitum]|nr:MFS transporter [Candidatus Methanoplasma termitum]MCL2333721.1 MFS transporter [Candidatus Methanoplasma sp.]
MKRRDKYAMTVLSVTTVGALLATMQGSALMIALPDMLESLRMDFMTMLWVLLIYLMVTTIMVPVLGRVSDMFGRKKMYVMGFGVFALGSLLCGLSGHIFNGGSGWVLVACRIVQALGGSMLLANSTAMITDAFLKNKLGFGLGVNSIAVAAGIVIGPVIGGIFVQVGWEWIFFFNVPIALFGMVWAWYRLKEPRWEVKVQTFDWLGTATFLVGLFGVLTALSYMSLGDAAPMFTVYVLTVIGVIFLALFIMIERKVRYPMMDLSLFRIRRYAVGNASNLLNGLCIGAATFLLIFYFQGPLGKDALTAGLLLIPSGVPMMIIGPLSGRWSDKYGPRLLTVVGLTLTTISLIGLAFIDAGTPLWWIIVLMVIMGCGGGLFMSPNASSVMTSIPSERRGTASGTRMMLRNTGNMFSLAIAFPIVLAGLSQSVMMYIFLGPDAGIPVDPSDLLAGLASFQSGLQLAFVIFAVISAISVFVALLNSDKKHDTGAA